MKEEKQRETVTLHGCFCFGLNGMFVIVMLDTCQNVEFVTLTSIFFTGTAIETMAVQYLFS